MMGTEFQTVFAALRAILRKHQGQWSVQEDSANCYSLAGRPGPATLQAWKGKLKRELIPIAWAQIGKAYTSYHLMGLQGNVRLLEEMSKDLKSRMQGKTCFNFTSVDKALFQELDDLTARAITGFKRVGYVVEVVEPAKPGAPSQQ
jgi:hypothetical protein